MHFPSLDYLLIIATTAQLSQQASAKATSSKGDQRKHGAVAEAPLYSVQSLPTVTPSSLVWYLPVKKHGNITYKAQRLSSQEDCNQVSECYWGLQVSEFHWALQDKTFNVTYRPNPIVTYPFNLAGEDSKRRGVFYCMWEDPDEHKNSGEVLAASAFPIFHQCSPYASTSLEKGADGKERNVTRIHPNCSTGSDGPDV